MVETNLKGIWIPIEIMKDKKLSDKEKMILSIIMFLSKENQYCYLTNKNVSELFNITTIQVSKLVNSLKKKGYITIELIYKENSKQIEMRKLTPIKNTNTYLTKVKDPIKQKFNTSIKEKFKDNKYNNKNINININKNNTDYIGRDYSDYDLTQLYANSDAFVCSNEFAE